MIVHLLRHGRTELDQHLIGRTNAALSPAGWTQMSTQFERLAWATIVASPLVRAQEPALAAAGRSGAVCRIDRDWREMDFGEWDGLPLDQIRQLHADAYRKFYSDPDAFPPPGGERWTSLAERVGRGLRKIVTEKRNAPVLVVTHAGAIRAAIAEACGLPRDTLWCLRIAHGTAITLNVDLTDGALWGEIVEIVQS